MGQSQGSEIEVYSWVAAERVDARLHALILTGAGALATAQEALKPKPDGGGGRSGDRGVAMGECLAVGGGLPVEPTGLRLGVDMADHWQG